MTDLARPEGADRPTTTPLTRGTVSAPPKEREDAREALSAPQMWKFTVPQPTRTGRSFIDLPNGARILSFGAQAETLVVWALVPPNVRETHAHRLLIANTGMPIPGFPVATARFLGTVTVDGIVWHAWDGDE